MVQQPPPAPPIDPDEPYDRGALETVLATSSDPDNPGPDEIYRVVRETLRFAVVGMSRDPSKPARRIPSYLAAKGGEVIPVNPEAERILGRTAYPTLDDVEEPVDMVLIFRPSEEAGEIVRAAMNRPEEPVIWLQEGIRADEEVAEARALGRTVVQDLCIYEVHRAFGDAFRRAQPPSDGS